MRHCALCRETIPRIDRSSDHRHGDPTALCPDPRGWHQNEHRRARALRDIANQLWWHPALADVSALPPARWGALWGQYFRCRTCHGLHYRSQYEPCYERAVNEADKLRARVGGSRGAFDEDPFPPKPKRMRWATYNRLQARYDRLVGWYESEFMRRFGSGS